MSQATRWVDGRPVVAVASLGQGAPLTEWLVVGPFPLDPSLYREQELGRADAVEIDPIGCATTIHPVEGMRHQSDHEPSGYTTWQKLTGQERYELRETYPSAGTALAYAATYLETEEETNVVLLARELHDHHTSVIDVLLDGVPVGRGGIPCLLHLSEGEHILLALIAGGASGRYAWQIDVAAGVPKPLNNGVHAALMHFPGFWQGPERAVKAAVEVAIANPSDVPVVAEGLKARLDDEEFGGPLPPVTLAPGAAKSVRLPAPLGKLTPGDRTSVTVAHAGVERRFAATIPALPSPFTIHLMEGFHCDPIWVSDQHHYNLVSLENVRQLIDGCLADPNYRVFLHEIDYLKPFVDEYPDYRAALFGLIQRGQVSLGSSYNQPNETNCSGEAIIRNILYGYGFHRQFLGGEPGVYHAWDVFGHIPQLAQIAAKSGLMGILWSKPILGFPPIFRHLALDGTTLPMIRSLYGWGTHSLDRLITSTAGLVEEKHSLGISRHLCVDSGDFSSPSGWMIGHTAEMARSYPSVRMTGPEEFLRGVAEDGSALRVTSRNPTQYHVGTQHSRSEMKIANRLCENRLVTAEKWATFAGLLGAKYPDLALDKAWRQVLFAEHHDALSGTPCDISYLDLMAGYREALELADEVSTNAMRYLARQVKVPPGQHSYVVFNPLNWARSGLVTVPKPEGGAGITVRDADGNALPSLIEGESVVFRTGDVPGIGYTTVTVTSTQPRDGAEAKREAHDGPVSIENEFWKLTVDPARGGGITGLIDKETDRQYIDGTVGVGNDLVALQENGARSGSPWEFWTTGAHHRASQWPAKVEVVNSPIEITLRITGTLSDVCAYERTLTLRPGERAIEASVVIRNYRRDDQMFVVATPVALSGAIPVVEERFGAVATKRNRRKFDYRTGGNTKYSDCAVFPPYNWIEAGWSARLDAGGESSLNLGLTSLVIPHDESIEAAMEPLMTALAHVGVTCTPRYDDDDRERRDPLEERYPESGNERTKLENTLWDRDSDLNMTNNQLAVTVAGNNRYVRDLLKRLPSEANECLRDDLGTRGWGVVLADDTNVPDGWDPVPTVILSARSKTALAEAITEISSSLARDGHVRLAGGCDFRSVRSTLDDAGFAILTNGTGGAAMEPDGTLTLMLTKSAAWADRHLEDGFVPERREMVFHYAFLPHEGSWREAEVVRAGYEFEHPLVAVPTHGGGTLPSEHRLLALDVPGAVVSAVKPHGNPVPSFKSVGSDPRKGVIVRAYGADGRGGSGRLSLAWRAKEAAAVNLMEEKIDPIQPHEGGVDWRIGPFSIETVRLTPVVGEPPGDSVSLGREAEPVQPVYSRYWKHNANVHPIGYLPVGIFITGGLEIENEGGNFPTVDRARVTVVNNYTDRQIEGVAHIVTPDRWTIIPDEIPFTLHPREHLTTEVTIACEKFWRTGIVKARLELDGQVYQDVLEIGRKAETKIGGGGAVRLNRMDIVKEREPEWSVHREGNDILVRVRNPWWEPLDVELDVVTPVEAWGRIAGRYGRFDVSPRVAGLAIPPRGTTTARFAVEAGDERVPQFWAWMKLTCNGKPDYRPVPGTSA